MCDSFGNYAAVTAFLQDVVDRRRLGRVWIQVYSIPLGIIWFIGYIALNDDGNVNDDDFSFVSSPPQHCVAANPSA